jgi:hypothetical protein
MNNTPRIKDVEPNGNMILTVIFQNGVIKEYDVRPLISRYDVFEQLENESIFNLARVDCGGFGVAWTDEIDLSEYEIWENGITISPSETTSKAC